MATMKFVQICCGNKGPLFALDASGQAWEYNWGLKAWEKLGSRRLASEAGP